MSQYITQFHLVDAEEERLSLDIWRERYSPFRTSSAPIASHTHTHIGDDEIMPSGIGLQIFLRRHYRHYHESTSCTPIIILAGRRYENGFCKIPVDCLRLKVCSNASYNLLKVNNSQSIERCSNMQAHASVSREIF